MSLDSLLTASALVQGAEAAVALILALTGLYFIVRRRRRPRVRFAADQNLRVSRSNTFTLSGIARNVEPGTLRLLCARLDDGITRYRDCGQIVLTGHKWKHRVSGRSGICTRK